MPLFEAVLGGASSQRLQDAMEGAASVSPVPRKAARLGGRSGPVHTDFKIKIMTEFFPKLTECQLQQLMFEECRQEGKAVLPQVADVGHSKPIRPQGVGRARLPNGRCNVSLNGQYEGSKRWWQPSFAF